MYRLLLLSMIGLMFVSGLSGCKHCGRCGLFSSRNDLPRRPPDDLLIPPPSGGLPSTEGVPSGGYLPPPTVNSNPNSSQFRPKAETLYPDPLLESPEVRPSRPGEPPAVLPIPDGSASSLKSAKPSVARRIEAERPPSGLPGFAVVRDRVSTGRKPTLQGFDTLRDTGYKSVLYLHKPNQDLTAVQQLVESKGLSFRAISSEPENLAESYSRFAEAVGETSRYPLYVFDDDGVRCGSLWYLYFRKVEALPDDAAQVKAAALGLREATGDEKTNFWLSIQQYLAKR